MTSTMKAAVFAGKDHIEIREKRIPDVGPNDALLKITTTTICDTDIHIVKGEYPVKPGLTIGHEPVAPGIFSKRPIYREHHQSIQRAALERLIAHGSARQRPELERCISC